ncbi:uncharacterized protein ARMOST_16802 [Armillaria ostoyae]|uniref:F-box domain-containing protein n=1 Tax=Armillaria ostoyae TaxID=47428 RepID=A0A284RX84_ARMOS|nr:uncharacterized protein ARMOST_16802 [Armillaria ostoyae]
MHTEAHIPFPAENLVLFSDARRLPDHDTVPRYLDIIASAPNLSDFSYHHYSVVPQPPGPYHPQIVHQSLQKLSASLEALLCSLVVPALTQMILASIKSEQDVTVCTRDALFHLHNLVVRSNCSLTTLTFIGATLDENLLPILRLSPQLVSLSFQDKQWSRDSVATMESLLLVMRETIRVGDALHHTLLPCLKHLEIVLQNVEFDTASYLDVDFVQMAVSPRAPLGSQMLESLRVVVEGRAFEVPFRNNGGLEELKRLGDGGLDLQLDLDDWDERVLLASALPHNPHDDRMGFSDHAYILS